MLGRMPSVLKPAAFVSPLRITGRKRALFAALLLPFVASASEWPQYGGPNFDRSTSEKLPKTWPSAGLKTLWRTPIDGGFSSVATAAGKVFTLTMRNIEGAPRETLIALDASSGKELWFAPVGSIRINDGGHEGASGNSGGDGPRCTPAVDGNRVYVYSYRMVLTCFDATTGKPVWSHDMVKEFGGQSIGWGNAASPLIEGDRVFVAAGGSGQSLLAFDKATGEVAWKKHSERITHATPVAANILGQRQIVFFTQSGLVSVNPDNGALFWKHPFRYSTSTAASPVVAGDIVYCSAGYGVGATAVRISRDADAFKATELWIKRGNRPVANHWSTPVASKGYLYGIFGFKEYGSGPMKCVELTTGAVKWEEKGFGAGQVILANDTVLALTDSGELVQVQPDPGEYHELSRARVTKGKCLSTPTVANVHIYVRSSKEIVCLDAGAAVAAR